MAAWVLALSRPRTPIDVRRRQYLGLLVFVAFLSAVPCVAVAGPLDTWHKRASGTSSHLRGIAYANGIFVAVGSGGTILSSPDGVTWTPRASGTMVDLNGVTYQPGRFFALGDSGSILTSSNGVDWSLSSFGSTFLYDVAYANGTYVLVGWDYIATSPNGESWTMTNENFPAAYTVAYGNGLFAYGGEDGNVKTSVDGQVWVERLHQFCATVKLLFTRGRFYAVGCHGIGDGSGYVSTDGLSWAPIVGVFEPSGPAARGIVYTGIADGDGNLVVVGYSRTSKGFADRGEIRTSVDGQTWVPRDPAVAGLELDGVAFGQNTFVVVGEGGTILQSDSTATISASIVANAAAYRTHDRLAIDLTVANAGPERAVDAYFGVVLPAVAGRDLGCPGGDAVAFLTAGLAAVQVTCLSASPQTFQPLAANVTLPGQLPSTTVTSFFNFAWTGNEPAGSYTFFLALTRSGAFSSGRIDPADLLAVGSQTVSFSP